jgi:N-acyl-D-amino-acid deacylase
VGIRGDRIAAVGDLSTRDASARLAVTGLTVTPGFIDTHTHDDSARLATPDMPFKVGQGVTTVVVGNCGISLAPLAPEGELPRPLDLLGDRSGLRYRRAGPARPPHRRLNSTGHAAFVHSSLSNPKYS